jgi:simple sugar transport system permease protein
MAGSGLTTTPKLNVLSPARLLGSSSRRGRGPLQQETVLAAVGVVLVLYFVVRAGTNFWSGSNAVTLSQYAAPIIIFAIAEVFLLILGQIDLSAAEVYVLSPFIVRYVAQQHLSVGLGIAVSLVVCAAIGAANGFITVKLRMPSFISTLAMYFALQGIVLIASSATQYQTAGSGQLAFILGSGAYSEILWAVGLVAALHLVLRRTTYGLHTLAAGGNNVASLEAGIRVDRIKIAAFMTCSVLVGFIGILDSYRIGTLNPSTDGLDLVFFGIAAAVIGGTPLTGGRGTVIGALIAGLVLGIMEDGFNIVGVSAFAYDLVLGIAIFIAMLMNIWLGPLTARLQRRRSLPDATSEAGTNGTTPERAPVPPPVGLGDAVRATTHAASASTEGEAQEVLRASGVTKSFNNITALRRVDLSLHRGEILGLVGDNGAGKSTLIKILTGFHRPDGGNLYVQGDAVTFLSTKDVRNYGIATVFQDLALIDGLSVYHNLFLNREITRFGWLRLLANRRMRESARRDLAELGITIPVLDTLTGGLSGGQRQAVAVARAVGQEDVKVLLLDEPLSAVSPKGARFIIELVKKLAREKGVAILMVSHNYTHVFDMCDRINIMDQGRIVYDRAVADTSLIEVTEFVVRSHIQGMSPDVSSV